MQTIDVVFLSLIQGLTEFLPISSSAHLILLPKLMGHQDQGLSFDIAVHFGTLLAVCGYYRHDLKVICCSLLKQIRTACQLSSLHEVKTLQLDNNTKLALAVLLGTIPVGLAGLLGKAYIEYMLRSPLVIAGATLIFGLLLLIADRTSKKNTRKLSSISIKDIVWVGCAQAVALIPGTSRSGITLTAALLCGFSRQDAAKYAFLLSIPVITLASLLSLVEIVQAPQTFNWLQLIAAVTLSAVSAFACIHFFLSLLEKIGLTPFVIYRVLLAGFLLINFY